MSANDYQPGGAHYKSEYQHWDWSIDVDLGKLEYAATKYVSRWWKKNGILDLEKPVHYMEKALEAFKEGRYNNTCLARLNNPSVAEIVSAQERTAHFVEVCGLKGVEVQFIFAAAQWTDAYSLQYAVQLGKLLLYEAQECGWRGVVPATASAGANPQRPAAKAIEQPIEVTLAGATTQAQAALAAVGPLKSRSDHPAPYGYPGEDGGVEE